MGLGEQPNKEAHASLLLTTISNNVLHTYTYKIYLHARVFFFFFKNSWTLKIYIWPTLESIDKKIRIQWK